MILHDLAVLFAAHASSHVRTRTLTSDLYNQTWHAHAKNVGKPRHGSVCIDSYCVSVVFALKTPRLRHWQLNFLVLC